MNTKNLKNLTGGGNTKLPPRNRRWCFTLNNWTEDEKSQLIMYFQGASYIIGDEICPSTKTPHLQGYVEFKNQKCFSALKKINPRISWRHAKGNKEQNITYCSKETNYTSNFPIPRKEQILNNEYKDVTWRPWQQMILDIIETKPDRRTINWFWEEKGNEGKTFIATYLVLKYDALVLSGKTSDISNQIKTWLDTHKDESFPTVAILDAPRSTQDFINYQALEKVKDGLIYSGKYEGGICILAPLHLFVFANQLPEFNKLSEDRWNIIGI